MIFLKVWPWFTQVISVGGHPVQNCHQSHWGGSKLVGKVTGALAIGGGWGNDQVHTDTDRSSSGSEKKH